MTVLFTPIDNSFTGLVAAGAGTVVQLTYTVPAGKRAVLTHSRVQGNANGNAALTTIIFIDVIQVASHPVIRRDISGLVGAQLNAEVTCNIDLAAGELVRIVTTNTGAAAVSMGGSFFIREYQ